MFARLFACPCAQCSELFAFVRFVYKWLFFLVMCGPRVIVPEADQALVLKFGNGAPE